MAYVDARAHAQASAVSSRIPLLLPLVENFHAIPYGFP